MAFWGVEVKPGKPFSHLPHSTGGRLHVSQATLGFGTATKKSVVQCNVGNKSPVFLCSLFPEQAESCQLNLEFEEVGEVIFSVIGPRSVHLTGYYLGASRQYKLDDESESYGVDIVDTETEGSDGVSDEDYEDSFIDDDEDLHVTPMSPFSDGVNEDLPHEGQKKDVKAKPRRLKKKYQSTHEDASQHQAFSNGGLDIMDSECEDMATIRSLVKSCAKKTKPGAEEECEKDGDQTVATDSELNRKSHEDSTQPLVENDPKQKKKKDKKAMKEKEAKVDEEDDFFGGEVLTWDKSRKNEAKFDHSSHDTALINADGESSGNNEGENAIEALVPPDDLINEIVAKTKKRKKKEKSETEVLGADKPFENTHTENQTQPDEARSGELEQVSLLKIDEDEKKANDEVKKAKTGKRKSKQGKEETALETDNSTRGDRAQLDEGSCENIEQGSLLEREDNQKQENDEVKKSKTGKRKHKQGKEEQVIGVETLSRENQAKLDEGSCEKIEQSNLLHSEDSQKQANKEGVSMLLSDELEPKIVKKPGKRKKKQAKEEKVLEAENTSSHLTHVNGVDLTQHNEAGCENTEIILVDNMPTNVEHQKQSNNCLQRPGVVIGLAAVSEPKKKRKKPAKDKALEADTKSIVLSIEEKANGDEQNHKQTIEFDVDNNADLPGNENYEGQNKRKKTENVEALNMDESMNTTVMDIEENDAKVKPKRVSRRKKKDVDVAAP